VCFDRRRNFERNDDSTIGDWTDTFRTDWFDRADGGMDLDAAWGLDGCCGVEENLFLTFYVVYAVLFFALNRWTCFKPMRLLAVFVHEFGHASGELS
jgi:hypothetical protein